MCCIFTCCGWLVDLIQRLWTFIMSCCISSAVCCLLMTSSMSGIALGYNYSLAEFIDLKESNVSVYLKRGVFDDDVVSEIDSRRSGSMPAAGQMGTDDLRAGAPAGEYNTPVQSARRLDDSLFESDDPNKYEGSLMKLTAQPPYPGTTTGTTAAPEYVELDTKFSPGSLNHLKAIQGMINARMTAMDNVGNQKKTTYQDIDARYLAQLPPNPNLPPSGRRMLQPPNMADRLNPARFAVPPQSIGSEENWLYPKDPVKYRKQFSYSDLDYPNFKPQYPKPIRLTTGPIRPPKPKTTPEMRTYRSEEEENTKQDIPFLSVKPEINPVFKNFQEKMMLQDFDEPENPKKSKDSSEDYEEDVKGLPVRRRRSIRSVNKSAKILERQMSTKVFKINNTNEKMINFEQLTNNNKIINDNINYNDGSVETEHSTVTYEDTQTILRHDTLKAAKKTLAADEIEITTAASSFQYKLIAKPTNKDSTQKHVIESLAFSSYPLKLGTDEKFNKESVSEDMATNTAKTLNTIGISVNDIKPSIMVRILKSTVT